jgi:uncharacterized iron-regulated membrane protein
MTRRTWFVLHSWLGLTLGLLLFVISWSGTVAVFSREIDWAIDGRMRAPAVDDAAIPWERIETAVRAAKPGWSLSQISAPFAPGFAVEAIVEDPQGVMGRVYADPTTGQVLGATTYFNVQRFFRSLHMSLFVGEWPIWGIPFGYLVVALLSIPLLAQLVTGLIFYRRFWRGFLKLDWNKGARVFWSDAHKLVGLWGLWFVLVIGLTGLWYLAEWKVTSQPPTPQARTAVVNSGEPPSLGLMLARARAAYPELLVREIALYRADEGLLEFQGQDGSLLVRDRGARVWVDNRTGEVVAVRRTGEMSLLHRWIDTADLVHFGTFGGLFTKAIWFIFGLALSAMCLSGAYLQAKRQERRGELFSPRAVASAYATSLAIIGVAVAFSLKELRGYGGGSLPDAPAGVWLVAAAWCLSTLGVLSWWIRAVGPFARSKPQQFTERPAAVPASGAGGLP